MQDIIKKILEIAVHAPSGENAQPWRFAVSGDSVSIYNIPERDQSLYNFNQLGSYVAHGALIENIVIAASARGCSASVRLFPDANDKNLIAIADIQKSNTSADPLYSYIEKRCTNRKPYEKNKPLSADQLRELERARETAASARVVFTQDKEKIKILARAGSVNEQVMFDNEFLHNFFFSHITWTKEEDEKKRLGFYIKTLEIPSPIQKIMKLFLRKWSVMKIFNKLGMAGMIAKGNAQTYASSSAIGVVVMPAGQPEDFVNAGRVTQRVWLTAAKSGLSVQPLTGVLFFTRGIVAGQTEHFAPRHPELIKNAYQDIHRAFDVGQNEAIIMMFRVGYAGTPTARAAKLSPEIIWN